MKEFTVKGSELTEIASEVSVHSVGQQILTSLREQRQQEIFCDICIECGNEKIVAHRVVLYAVSDYCRTFLKGSFASSFTNGFVTMNLDPFPFKTVKMFVCLIYGESLDEEADVDVGELLQLAYYLQAHKYIDIFTEMLRKMITVVNCVPLYELCIMYDCRKLQKIVEYFICSNLKRLIDRHSLEALSEKALSSLSSAPSFLSQPVQLIQQISETSNFEIDSPNILMAYCSYVYPKLESLPHPIDSDATLCTFKRQLPMLGPVKSVFFYFMFNHELYVVFSKSGNYHHVIYKYDKIRKAYSIFLVLMSGKMNNNNEMSHGKVKIRSVFSNISHDYVLILFHAPVNDRKFQSLIKVDMGITSNKPTLVYERKIKRHAYMSHARIFHKGCIYTFRNDEYMAYNVETNAYQVYEHEQDNAESLTFCQFQNQIYSLEVKSYNWMKLYCFNEKGGTFETIFEQPFEHESRFAEGVSSQKEMIFIVNIDYDHFDDDSDDSDTDEEEEELGDGGEFKTLLYRFDPKTKALKFWKRLCSNCDKYLFVPEDLFD